MLDRVIDHLRVSWPRVYGVGGVPNSPVCPYLFVYALSPGLVRSMARPESARRHRFGVTVVDQGGDHIESDADEVEALLEGSRFLGASSRIELASRGPTIRDPEVTTDGQEYVTLPLTFTVTLPKEVA